LLVQQTLEKLYDLRLKGMAHAFSDQAQRGEVADLSFDERFGLLVDQEWLLRQERKVHSRLKTARLKQNACAEDIDYRQPRGLDKTVVLDLLTCSWIRAGHNLILTGATGLGKTWLACALADRACREGLSAHYTRVPRLIHELAMARAEGSYLKRLAKLARMDLLILDDWGLAPLDGQGQHDLLEVVDDRAGSRSTLVTSQLPIAKWHDMVADPSVADALLDRLAGAAIKIQLKGGSMRKEKSKVESL